MTGADQTDQLDFPDDRMKGMMALQVTDREGTAHLWNSSESILTRFKRSLPMACSRDLKRILKSGWPKGSGSNIPERTHSQLSERMTVERPWVIQKSKFNIQTVCSAYCSFFSAQQELLLWGVVQELVIWASRVPFVIIYLKPEDLQQSS